MWIAVLRISGLCDSLYACSAVPSSLQYNTFSSYPAQFVQLKKKINTVIIESLLLWPSYRENFEGELIREEMCFMVSLKQLLKSIFLKVWICARLSHPKSRLLPPYSQLYHVLAQGADGAGYGSSTGFPTSTNTLDRSSHTAQGMQNCGRFTGIFLKTEV